MNRTKAIYAASLDPITNGHLWVIDQGIKLFDEIVVAVAVNPSKVGKYFFEEEERRLLAQMSIPWGIQVVRIGPKYLVDFVIKIGATHLLRGARSAEDFNVEANMATINREMLSERGAGEIETVILTPPPKVAGISSSFVKSLIGYDGWQKEIKKYVPTPVHEAILQKMTK